MVEPPDPLDPSDQPPGFDYAAGLIRAGYLFEARSHLIGLYDPGEPYAEALGSILGGLWRFDALIRLGVIRQLHESAGDPYRSLGWLYYRRQLDLEGYQRRIYGEFDPAGLVRVPEPYVGEEYALQQALEQVERGVNVRDTLSRLAESSRLRADAIAEGDPLEALGLGQLRYLVRDEQRIVGIWEPYARRLEHPALIDFSRALRQAEMRIDDFGPVDFPEIASHSRPPVTLSVPPRTSAPPPTHSAPRPGVPPTGGAPTRRGGRERMEDVPRSEPPSRSERRSPSRERMEDMTRGAPGEVPAGPLPPPAGSPPDEPAATLKRTVKRTPHMDVSKGDGLLPGDEVDIEVFADVKAAREGERSDDIEVEVERDVVSLDLETDLLVSPHLEIVTDASGILTIVIDEADSEHVRFKVRVRDEAVLDALAEQLPAKDLASVTAIFRFEGRPCGRVDRVLSLNVPVEEHGPEPISPRPPGAIRVETGLTPPDLLVEVRAQPINDGRQFQCRVSTPASAPDREAEWEDWNLSARAEELVFGFMERFVEAGSTAKERLSALKGAGLYLFEASPPTFQERLWELVDAGTPPKSILVATDEPFIPWELMIPIRRKNGRREKWDLPLGVKFNIGRWVLKNGTSPAQAFPLHDSIVIAPRYSGNRELEHAQAEVDFVLQHFPGTRIDPATLEQIDATLRNQKASLLHFTCHGADRPGTQVAQAIYLDHNRLLDTTNAKGLNGFWSTFEDVTTLVVINACEVGRPAPALVGVGGFAETFIEQGAAGVIAALWSVRDDLAHEIALDFYRRTINEPGKPFAEILRDVRRRAYEEAESEDTYAAYCFYGDPLAVRVSASTQVTHDR